MQEREIDVYKRQVHNSVVYSDLTKKSEVKGENMKYTICLLYTSPAAGDLFAKLPVGG